jgi:hypothetical protein
VNTAAAKTMWILVLVLGALNSCLEVPSVWRQSNPVAGKKQFAKGGGTVLDVEKDSATGAMSAAAKAGSTETQSIQVADNADLVGSEIAFPPGTLAVDTSITVESGVPFDGGAVKSVLELEEGQEIEPVGGTLVLSSSEPVDAVGTIQVAMPLNQSVALLLTAPVEKEKIIVIYKVQKYAENTFAIGIIPSSELTFQDDKVIFGTSYFGSFQLAISSVEITDRPPEAKTEAPILTKAAASSLPEIVWNTPSGTSDEDLRSIALTGSVEGLESSPTCRLIVDRDKQTPWDVKVDGVDIASAQGHFVTGKAETYFGKFVCEESNGRITESPWSSSIAAKALISSVSGLSLDSSFSTATATSPDQTLTVGGAGVASYSYTFAVGGTGTCSISALTTFASTKTSIQLKLSKAGKATLCVLGKDRFGNTEVTPTKIQWDYKVINIVPGNPTSFSLASDQAFLSLSWSQSAQQSSQQLVSQNIRIYDKSCAGTPIDNFDVAKLSTSALWHRFKSGKTGPFYFTVSFTDTSGRVTTSACSTASAVSDALAIYGDIDGQALGGKTYLHDVTGDSYPDLIAIRPTSYGDQGSYIYVLPSDQNISSSRARVYTGASGDRFDRGIEFADVNGDGYDDIVASGVGTDNYGILAIVFGGSNLLASGTIETQGRRYTGAAAGDGLGSLLKLADVNKDGRADVIASAGNDSTVHLEAGAIYVIPGSSSLPSSRSITGLTHYEYLGTYDYQHFPGRIDVVDLTGDGFPEVISSSSGANGEGILAVVVSGPMPTNGELSSRTGLRIYTGDAPGDYLDSPGFYHDVTGDGILDFVAGFPGAASYAGAIYVILGGPTLHTSGAISTAGFRYSGDSSDARVGSEIRFGDFDGNGVDDVFSADPVALANVGAAYVVLMGTTPPASGVVSSVGRAYTGNNSTSDIQLGATFEVGDVTGDGKDDILAGSQQAYSSAGALYIVPGAATPPGSGTIDQVANARTYSGANAGDFFGGYRLAINDVTGDGIMDIFSYYTSCTRNSQPRTVIWFLKGQANLPASGGSASTFAEYVGDGQGYSLNSDLKFLDVNADGKLDLIGSNWLASIGAYSYNGSLFVISGSATMPSSGYMADIGHLSFGSQDYHYFGLPGSPSDPAPKFLDINQDGRLDFVKPGGSSIQSFFIAYGQSNGGFGPPISNVPNAYQIQDASRGILTWDANKDNQVDVVSLMASCPYSSCYGASTNGLQYNGGLLILFNDYLSPN